MTTPWTPPGAELPEPTPAPSAPPPLPKYPRPQGFQGYPGYAGGPRPLGPPPSKTMAGWALGLAVFGCSIITWIIGAVLAIQVLVESRREQRDQGIKLAVAALVLLAGWAVVAVVVLASGVLGRLDLTEGFDQAGDPVESGRINPSRLDVGDCLDDPTLANVPADGDTVETGLVTVVACDRPHDLETFLSSDLLGKDYPGLDDLQRRSAEACEPAFKVYVGKALGPSKLVYWVYYPSERAWNNFADHRITCVVGSAGEKTTGTLQGSRR